VLYWATDFGTVVAIDVHDGRIRWVVTYPAIERPAIDRSDESAVGLLPPLVDEGVVYVKPNDANELLAIDAGTGFVYWRRRPPGQIVHLLGVTASKLLVSGSQLWALDVETGRTNWRFGFDDAAGFGYGRGVVIGDRILWPTREELFSVDVDRGTPMRRVPLRDSLGISGGHLLVSDRHLLICGPDHLTAFPLIPGRF
jgi:outer membrane protein assembly factor BamB